MVLIETEPEICNKKKEDFAHRVLTHPPLKKYILDYKMYTQCDRIEMGVVFFLCAKQKKRHNDCTVNAFMSLKTGLLGFSFEVKS